MTNWIDGTLIAVFQCQLENSRNALVLLRIADANATPEVQEFGPEPAATDATDHRPWREAGILYVDRARIYTYGKR